MSCYQGGRCMNSCQPQGMSSCSYGPPPMPPGCPPPQFGGFTPSLPPLPPHMNMPPQNCFSCPRNPQGGFPSPHCGFPSLQGGFPIPNGGYPSPQPGFSVLQGMAPSPQNGFPSPPGNFLPPLQVRNSLTKQQFPVNGSAKMMNPPPQRPPVAFPNEVNRRASMCGCKGGTTLCCVPRGKMKVPFMPQNNSFGPQGGGMPPGFPFGANEDQPLAFNNCNFYVSELPFNKDSIPKPPPDLTSKFPPQPQGGLNLPSPSSRELNHQNSGLGPNQQGPNSRDLISQVPDSGSQKLNQPDLHGQEPKKEGQEKLSRNSREPIQRDNNSRKPIEENSKLKVPNQRNRNSREPIKGDHKSREEIQLDRSSREAIQPDRNSREQIQPDRKSEESSQLDCTSSETIQGDRNSGEPSQVGLNSHEPIQPDRNSSEPIKGNRNSREPLQADRNSSEPIKGDRNSRKQIQGDRNSREPLQPNRNSQEPIPQPNRNSREPLQGDRNSRKLIKGDHNSREPIQGDRNSREPIQGDRNSREPSLPICTSSETIQRYCSSREPSQLCCPSSKSIQRYCSSREPSLLFCTSSKTIQRDRNCREPICRDPNLNLLLKCSQSTPCYCKSLASVKCSQSQELKNIAKANSSSAKQRVPYTQINYAFISPTQNNLTQDPSNKPAAAAEQNYIKTLYKNFNRNARLSDTGSDY